MLLVTIMALCTLPPPGNHTDIIQEHFFMNLPAGNGSHRVDVYYPADLENGPYPLVSFAHGMLAGGPTGRPVYKTIIAEIVAMGAILIAPESCLLEYCDSFYLDQLAVIEASKNLTINKAFAHIDHNNVGVLGHSMGGQATEQSAGRENALKHNIKAAAAVHPVSNPKWGIMIDIPILYTTGNLDIQAPAVTVKLAYDATRTPHGMGTTYANLRGANHYEPCNLGEGKLDRYVAYYFACHLANNAEACPWVAPAKLCAAYDFVECEAK